MSTPHQWSNPTVEPGRHPRDLTFEGLPNARDLGGVNLRGGGVVDCGKLIRTASPQFLTPTGAEQLYSYGVRSVIDLRSPSEAEREGHGPLQAFYDSNNIAHHSLPLISDAQRVIDPIGSAADTDPARGYINYLQAGEQFVRIAQIVTATATEGHATVLHCALGKDRTGVAISVLLDAVGSEHHEIVDDYALTARAVQEMVTRLGSSGSYARDFTDPDWDALAPKPHGIAGMLRWMQIRHGGAADFLLSEGLGADVLDRLRRTLRYLPQHLRAVDHASS